MAAIRILGYIMITLGVLLSITIIGAPIGVPMLLFGVLFVVIARKRTPMVIHIQNTPEVPPK